MTYLRLQGLEPRCLWETWYSSSYIIHFDLVYKEKKGHTYYEFEIYFLYHKIVLDHIRIHFDMKIFLKIVVTYNVKTHFSSYHDFILYSANMEKKLSNSLSSNISIKWNSIYTYFCGNILKLCHKYTYLAVSSFLNYQIQIQLELLINCNFWEFSFCKKENFNVRIIVSEIKNKRMHHKQQFHLCKTINILISYSLQLNNCYLNRDWNLFTNK